MYPMGITFIMLLHTHQIEPKIHQKILVALDAQRVLLCSTSTSMYSVTDSQFPHEWNIIQAFSFWYMQWLLKPKPSEHTASGIGVYESCFGHKLARPRPYKCEKLERQRLTIKPFNKKLGGYKVQHNWRFTMISLSIFVLAGNVLICFFSFGCFYTLHYFVSGWLYSSTRWELSIPFLFFL